MSEKETDWECKSCKWFLFASALKWQRSMGVQGEIPTCPNCRRPLTPCKIGTKV